jgi:hypothetical protein
MSTLALSLHDKVRTELRHISAGSGYQMDIFPQVASVAWTGRASRQRAKPAQGAGERTRRDAAMLRIMTYNICLGGVDDDTTNRLPLIHEVVREGHPDVLAVQEANKFDLRQYRPCCWCDPGRRRCHAVCHTKHWPLPL